MKTKKDIFWNYLSLVVMAAMGFAINAVIIHDYNSSVLGMYNETYAWYMIISQIAVWGTHMAVVKFIPETDDANKRHTILKSAIVVAVITSLITTVIVYAAVLCIHFTWKMFICRAMAGLLLYSINKIMLNYLNGINRMTIYAIVQIIRYVSLFGVVLVLSVCNADGEYLSLTFPITECIVLFVLCCVFLNVDKGRGHTDINECKRIIQFGTRILPSNMVLEINSKVDVICLGFFIKNMSMIGIYSFAIYFTDGMYQLFIVLRRLINPHIAQKNMQGELKHYLDEILEKSRKLLLFLSVVGYLIVIVAYYLISRFIVGSEYIQGTIYLIIIGLAIVLTGRYIILGNILAQTGYPLDESKINILTVCINAIANCIMICIVGMTGAAISTALSYIAFACLVRCVGNKRLNINF